MEVHIIFRVDGLNMRGNLNGRISLVGSPYLNIDKAKKEKMRFFKEAHPNGKPGRWITPIFFIKTMKVIE